MSALLPINAMDMNLCAEYGYSSRTFNKYPMVYQSNEYKSCLFLVYTQIETIPHRMKEYRNHFTLFRNQDSLVVCRTETSLVHMDNDAIIDYDIIQMSPELKDRYRSNYKGLWDVSFDRIVYSNEFPKLAGYSLVCSGEWWFFDKGIILNGLTGYEDKKSSLSMFIYYELHINYTLNIPGNQSMIPMPPVISSLTTAVAPEKPIDTTVQQVASQIVEIINKNDKSSVRPRPDLQPQNNQKIYSALLDQLCEVTSGSQNPMAALGNIEIQQPPPPQPPPQQPQQQASSINSGNNVGNRPTALLPQLTLSSLPSTTLPFINGNARPIIRGNDTVKPPVLQQSAVIPSLHWFESRSNELKRGNIEYFRPLDFSCPIRGDGGRTAILNISSSSPWYR